MQLSQKIGLAPVHRFNRRISLLGASCLCLCLREGDDARAAEVRSLAVYHDRQMAVLRRRQRMEWRFCVGWCVKTQMPRLPSWAPEQMTHSYIGRPAGPYS